MKGLKAKIETENLHFELPLDQVVEVEIISEPYPKIYSLVGKDGGISYSDTKSVTCVVVKYNDGMYSDIELHNLNFEG